MLRSTVRTICEIVKERKDEWQYVTPESIETKRIFGRENPEMKGAEPFTASMYWEKINITILQ